MLRANGAAVAARSRLTRRALCGMRALLVGGEVMWAFDPGGQVRPRGRGAVGVHLPGQRAQRHVIVLHGRQPKAHGGRLPTWAGDAQQRSLCLMAAQRWDRAAGEYLETPWAHRLSSRNVAWPGPCW
jgi:hypothetical protein